jgi:hypothetical protein
VSSTIFKKFCVSVTGWILLNQYEFTVKLLWKIDDGIVKIPVAMAAAIDNRHLHSTSDSQCV